MANYNTKDIVEIVKSVVNAMDTPDAGCKADMPKSQMLGKANYMVDRVVIVTGAGSGFGMNVSKIAAAKGAKVVLADISEDNLKKVTGEIVAAGGKAEYKVTDVTKYDDMEALADFAVKVYGGIDIMLNNAGTMPLAYFRDHKQALRAWDKCIDINIKGVLYGMCAVYDQMIKQGRGHIMNVSSVYGRFPVAGSGVYQATKSAVRFLTSSMRQEDQGRIKTTIINPTGCPHTGLFDTVIGGDGITGATGDHLASFNENFTNLQNGTLAPEKQDRNSIKYWTIDAKDLAEKVVDAMNTPWGLDVSEITVRATGEDYIV